MNPPFRKTKEHVKAALSLLEPGGELYAIVPCTFDYPGAEKIEDLKPGTFAATMARTKIIYIER